MVSCSLSLALCLSLVIFPSLYYFLLSIGFLSISPFYFSFFVTHFLALLENSVKTLFFRSFFVCRKESGKDDGRTGKADQRDADEGDGL